MTEEKISAVIAALGDELPNDKLLVLKNKLKDASDERADDIMMLGLHKPVNILLLSIFFGGLGVDRFVIGDTGLGVGKLLLGWATCGLWWFIDLFLISKRTKEKNFEKVMLLL